MYPVEAISVAAQMRDSGSSVLSALSLFNERASCPLPIHADVFVFKRFVRRVRTVYKGLCVVRA